MQLRRIAALCALMMPLASSASAQKFTGVIQQQVIEIFNETVLQLGGELAGTPTPEQEAYGFDPATVMKLSPQEALSAANEVDGSYNETVNTIYVGSTAIRADFQTPMDMTNKISYIVRRAQNAAVLIMHAQRKYVELEAQPAAQAVHDGAPSTAADDGRAPLQKTGERMVVNGVECERYLARDAQGIRELWVSMEHADLRAAFDLLRDQMVKGVTHEVAADDAAMWQAIPDGFPLIVKELTPGGSLSIEEIRSIKRQNLDPKIFDIPAGFKKTSLTEMMKIQMEMDDKAN